jgi:hypothetical protein
MQSRIVVAALYAQARGVLAAIIKGCFCARCCFAWARLLSALTESPYE